MKQIITLLSVILSLSACSSNESKIKSMQEESIKLEAKIRSGNKIRETLTDELALRASDSIGNADKFRYIALMKSIDSLTSITPVK